MMTMTCLLIGCIFFWICCAAVLVIDLLGWICFTKDGNRHMRHMFIDTYADLKHIEVETGNCINNDTRQCILELRSEDGEHILSDLITQESTLARH